MDKIIFLRGNFSTEKTHVLPSTPGISKFVIKGSDSKYFKL